MWKVEFVWLLHFNIAVIFAQNSFTPIVMWHSVGDTCCSPDGLGKIISALEEQLPGVHVHSLQFGYFAIQDFLSGYIQHPDRQVEQACDIIKSDPLLANGYHALGFSQGSQFLRAVAQRCPEPRMMNLITLGGQHQGVYGIPRCTWAFCGTLTDFLNPIANNKYILKFSVQANYWHDAKDITSYRRRNSFLADINNENNVNQEYIKNLQSLENLVLVQFDEDEMVVPRESQWFGFFKPNQTTDIQPLQDSEVYERLGLREMDAAEKLHFLTISGEHLQIPIDWFIEEIVNRFLK